MNLKNHQNKTIEIEEINVDSSSQGVRFSFWIFFIVTTLIFITEYFLFLGKGRGIYVLSFPFKSVFSIIEGYIGVYTKYVKESDMSSYEKRTQYLYMMSVCFFRWSIILFFFTAGYFSLKAILAGSRFLTDMYELTGERSTAIDFIFRIYPLFYGHLLFFGLNSLVTFGLLNFGGRNYSYILDFLGKLVKAFILKIIYLHYGGVSYTVWWLLLILSFMVPAFIKIFLLLNNATSYPISSLDMPVSIGVVQEPGMFRESMRRLPQRIGFFFICLKVHEVLRYQGSDQGIGSKVRFLDNLTLLVHNIAFYYMLQYQNNLYLLVYPRHNFMITLYLMTVLHVVLFPSLFSIYGLIAGIPFSEVFSLRILLYNICLYYTVLAFNMGTLVGNFFGAGDIRSTIILAPYLIGMLFMPILNTMIGVSLTVIFALTPTIIFLGIFSPELARNTV